MSEPLYVVRDNLLQTESAPMSRGEAGAKASADTLAAAGRGEPVATAAGVDRFTVKRAPGSPEAAPTYTALQAEAALCLWEAMIDARMTSTLPALDSAWEAAGAATMRHHALALAPFALAVYDALPAEARECVAYDYEIIPAVLAVVRWSGAGYALPPVEDAARDVAAAIASTLNPAPFPVTTRD